MIGNSWDSIFNNIYCNKQLTDILNFVKEERKDKTIYPQEKDVFNAFKYTDFKNVKVVILGQDPYHGENQAMGLAFSVKNEIKMPPSLVNIFKELKTDIGIKRTNSDLTDWAMQGVLLLNTVLTVEKDKANSHKNLGWENFTDYVIKEINDKLDNVVFILWGRQAQLKEELITNPSNLIIKSAHPSPLSAYNGFFGSKPFSKTNEFLASKNKGIIKF